MPSNESRSGRTIQVGTGNRHLPPGAYVTTTRRMLRFWSGIERQARRGSKWFDTMLAEERGPYFVWKPNWQYDQQARVSANMTPEEWEDYHMTHRVLRAPNEETPGTRGRTRSFRNIDDAVHAAWQEFEDDDEWHAMFPEG